MRITARMLADRLGDRVVATRGLDGPLPEHGAVQPLLPSSRRLAPGGAYVIPSDRAADPPEADASNLAICQAPWTADLPCPTLVCRGPLDALFQDCERAFDAYSRLEEQLIDGLVEDRPVEALLGALSVFTGNILELLDPSLHVIARINPVLAADGSVEPRPESLDIAISASTISAMAQSNVLRETFESRTAYVFRSPLFDNASVILNLFHGDEFLGQLVHIATRRPVLSGDPDLLDRLGRHFRHLLLRRSPAIDASLHPVEYFVAEMLGGRIADRAFMAAQLAPLGWRLDDPYAVLHLRRPTTAPPAYYVSRVAEALGCGLAFSFEDGVVALLRTEDCAEEEAAMRLEPFLAGADLVAGLSERFTDFLAAGAFLVQARDAGRLGALEPGRPRLVRYRDHAIDHLALSALEAGRDEAFLHPAIRRLEAAEGHGRSELLETLRRFVRSGGNFAATAASLHIHRNSLKYRLKRIREITGIDPEDMEERLRITLSFRMRDVKAALVRGG